ncbi:unnamed protein product [Discula destructiva]
MWSGSHLKFEHPQQPGAGAGGQLGQQHAQAQAQEQDNDFSPAFHQMRHPSTTPSTPTHHRRGQSLSAVNAPRTPNHLSLRPPVYLNSPMAHSPMAQSPMASTHQSTGLMGVGDIFNPPSGSFNENMGYYSPAMSSPGTALDNLNEEIANFDLSNFGGPLSGDNLFESPMPSPGHTPAFSFNSHNPFTSPPETFLPARTASPLAHGLPNYDPNTGHMDSYIRTPQESPSRHPFRNSIISNGDQSPTHHINPLRESLLQARQPSPSRDVLLESHLRTPDASPSRHSFSHPSGGHLGNPLHGAPDLRPQLTPRGSQSPTRSRQGSPSRRMRAHQRTQSLVSVNSVMSLADGDMEQYRVESNIKPEQIAELIGESDAGVDAASPAAADGNKKFICKWLEATKDTGEERICGQFFERKENCKAHIQTHLDDRQYKCPYDFCAKLFVRSHDLRRHLRTHDVHKKWVCPCGRDFSRADALHRHQGRGNCIGAPPGTKRKEPAKRGRPPKKKDVPADAEGGNNSPNPTSTNINEAPQPLPQQGLNNAMNSANFAPMGIDTDDYQKHDFPGFDEDMTGMGELHGMPDFATDPSPSPNRPDDISNAGGLAPSPLEEELSSSPMPPQDDHLGDDWLEDLIFINDNFADDGEVLTAS